MSKYITIEQLAENLQVRPSTVRSWVYKDVVPHLKFGRAVRFDLDEVSRWARENSRYRKKFDTNEAEVAAQELTEKEVPLLVSAGQA